MPSGAATMTSKLALAPSASERPENSGLTPIMLPLGVTGKRDLALDRAAARLGHAHRDLRFERMRARRRLVELDGKLGIAGVVGRRQIVERLLRRIDFFVGEPELIAGKAGALFRGRDRHLAFEIEIGGRRAIEETAGNIDLGRRVLRKSASVGEVRSNSMRSGT